MAIATLNPATGEVEMTFEPHGPQEIENRLARAQSAVFALRGTSFADRAGWMRAAADLLDDDNERIATIMTREMGKPIGAARAEAAKCAKGMRFYADHAEEFLRDEVFGDPGSLGASRAFSRYEPLGIVLAVMPWNYPLWQVIRFAAPALMAGNVGVLKHASNVPQSALYLDTLFARGGFPAGSFSTLLIGSGEVRAVLEDPRVKAVTLTGSEPAGRSVASIAGAQVKKSVLELGGSDPFIVMPSADLSAAVATAVTARTINNGQSCISAKRFIVHTDVYDRFAELFTAAMGALRVGDPLREETQVGPLATAAGRDELAQLVDDALTGGATALTGGAVPEGVGWYYPPTVISGVTASMRLHREEAFGPVATLYRVDDVDSAIALANVTDFGLSSSVWTTDQREKARFVSEIEAGAVFLNGMTISYPELPFGGIKNSGFGRELAAEGIREFCNLKTVWEA
ncbi:NADP-dependent succinic semialdehyde dehydrogenase [Lacisediminihabitans profunda]|uniref:NADP-dependent succinic semialdehyde dehydrogenase n=1 Tax=Lacisediminihabitans profunda TaxID=2594790 RepID=A0A5C8UM02_9MICO|nr:NADP-dependent succinic semialdehyde dehydrogenase [Lacisediminihabitans profunda]TXN29382.1 NADP-dependent succinic semialdehyde dehydrogenase [Lacisediminihabitans profunda]